MDDNKGKALAAALAQIEKQFGKGSIMKMGDAQIQNDLQVVSTGSLGSASVRGSSFGARLRPTGRVCWRAVTTRSSRCCPIGEAPSRRIFRIRSARLLRPIAGSRGCTRGTASPSCSPDCISMSG